MYISFGMRSKVCRQLRILFMAYSFVLLTREVRWSAVIDKSPDDAAASSSRRSDLFPDGTAPKHDMSLVSQQSLSLSTTYQLNTSASLNHLPKWLQDYVVWHHQQRSRLTEDNWESQTYFIQRCLYIDDQCGGTSDRLRSVPVKLRLAAKMKRLFFLYWERPCPLQEFLVPHNSDESLFDWTVPDWLQYRLVFEAKPMLLEARDDMLRKAYESTDTIVDTKSSFGTDAGAGLYNSMKDPGEPDFDQVFYDVWQLLFQLAPPVQAVMERKRQELQLRPFQYNAVHIRASYLAEEWIKPGLVENATLCGLSFNSTAPLYIATDSMAATHKALQFASRYTSQAVTYNSSETPLHLDRGRDFISISTRHEKHVPSDYYSTFVDLYLLAQSRCLAVGRGSYGRWANLMRQDKSCYLTYFDHNQWNFPKQCFQWDAKEHGNSADDI
jgi:hypothetical protein